jgi:hypothetical protein
MIRCDLVLTLLCGARRAQKSTARALEVVILRAGQERSDVPGVADHAQAVCSPHAAFRGVRVGRARLALRHRRSRLSVLVRVGWTADALIITRGRFVLARRTKGALVVQSFRLVCVYERQQNKQVDPIHTFILLAIYILRHDIYNLHRATSVRIH